MEIEISVFVRPGPTPGENKGWNTKTIAMDFPFAAAVASIDAATWLTKAVLKSLVDQAMVASTEPVEVEKEEHNGNKDRNSDVG